jgi:hypothetical protein
LEEFRGGFRRTVVADDLAVMLKRLVLALEFPRGFER